MTHPLNAALAYLATPYSKYPAGQPAAFVDAAKLSAKLFIAGVRVYSPIVHTHPLAVYGNLDPLDDRLWLPFEEALMARADLLLVAHMVSWETSKGMAHEIAFFTRANKPIFDLDPVTLAMTRRREAA